MDLGSEFRPTTLERQPSLPITNPPCAAAVAKGCAALSLAGAMQELIDDLPEQIALLDENGAIVAVNRAWKQTIHDHGYVELVPGGNYRDFCRQKAAEGYEPAVDALAALEDILSGARSFWQLVYNGRDRWNGRDYQITLHSIGTGVNRLISVTRYDLTEILELRRSKAQLESSLSASQTLERQRMARELHDSAGQLLTGMSLLLCRLKREVDDEAPSAVVDELQTLVSEAAREIRLISYLACAPEVEKLGLVEALKILVEGFGRRTGIEISFEVGGDPRSLGAGDTALYRVVQEGLSNIHRHSKARRARVAIYFRPFATHLILADDGIGLSAREGAGVGLVSMKARLSELGGRLAIRRLAPGTAIVASLPFQPGS